MPPDERRVLPPISAPAVVPERVSRRGWVLAAMVATIFISAVEGTIVATAMPAIVGALGGFELFSWVFTAYLLTQAVTTPIYGRLADLYGRKRVLLVGLGIFLAGSVLCGFAPDMTLLVLFRIAQGIGAGALMPVSQTVIGDLYPPAERARIQGWFSAVWAGGAILGPLLGAFLIAHSVWPAVFWVNMPIGLVGAVLLVTAFHEQAQHRRHRIDYLGSTLMMAGTGVLMFALVDGARLGALRALILIAAAAALLILFLLHERRSPEPMLPLDLFRDRVIASGNAAFLALGAVIMGATAFLSLYVQGVMGESAFVAGSALAAPSLSWPLGSWAGGRLMLKTSYRATAVVGGLILLTGTAMMILLEPSRGASWAIVAAVLIGIGMGFANNTFVVAIQHAVEWGRRGVATATGVFSRIVGQALGAAVFGGLLNAALSGRVAESETVVRRILDPALRRSLPAELAGPLYEGIALGLHHVYWITGALALVVTAVALGLPAGMSPLEKGRS